jgi:outer membrane receptor for ferrienterochelin and colicins
MNKKNSFIATLLFSMVAFSVHASNSAKNEKICPNDSIALNEVVVTATRNPTTKWLAPSLVNVLPHKIFEDTQASCLVQGLSFVPGVRVEDNCQNCGWTQARINGLDGHYSQILIDSRPIFSALTSVYGLEQLPANMIDHVEVIRGGGSALFGSSAIGGTINVITKEPTKNGGALSHSITSIGGTNTFENNTTINASVVSDNKKAGLYLYGANRERQPYDADGDGFSDINKIKTKTIGARAVLKPSDYAKISIDYHGITDYRRGGDSINLPPHQANLAETTQHTINGGGINLDMATPSYRDKFNTYFSFQNTDRNSYYGADRSLNNYGLTHDFTYIFGTQYTHIFSNLLFMPADLTMGAEYNSDNMKDQTLGYNILTNQHTRTSSVFAQNEWKTNVWSILLGGRLDKHNMINHAIFSPRVNLRYTPSRAWNFRASLSGGFRAPQAYDEDLHIDLVNGVRRVIQLAANLKQESSTSWSGSADYNHRFGNVLMDFLVEGFYTDLRNTFALRQLGETNANGDEVDERYNASGSRVYGLNSEVQAAFGSFMDLQAGLTWQKSKYKEAQQWSSDAIVPAEKRIFRTPDIYGYLTANITPFEHFSSAITGTYTGSMLVQHLAGSGVSKDISVETPRFFDAGIKLAYDISLCDKAVVMQINGGMLNVFDSFQKDFDKGKDRDSNYIYGPMMPRSYYAGVKFTF